MCAFLCNALTVLAKNSEREREERRFSLKFSALFPFYFLLFGSFILMPGCSQFIEIHCEMDSSHQPIRLN